MLVTVLTCAHPMMSLLHLGSSASSTPILDDTLLPPTMATNGRAGAVTAPLRKQSSCDQQQPCHWRARCAPVRARRPLQHYCKDRTSTPSEPGVSGKFLEQPGITHLLEQQAGDSGAQVLRHPRGGGVRAVCAAKCVHDEEVCWGRQLQRAGRVRR